MRDGPSIHVDKPPQRDDWASGGMLEPKHFGPSRPQSEAVPVDAADHRFGPPSRLHDHVAASAFLEAAIKIGEGKHRFKS